MRLTLMPIHSEASVFWDTARMAMPTLVFFDEEAQGDQQRGGQDDNEHLDIGDGKGSHGEKLPPRKRRGRGGWWTPWREKRTFCRIMDTPIVLISPVNLGRLALRRGSRGGLLIADAQQSYKSRMMAAREIYLEPSMTTRM